MKWLIDNDDKEMILSWIYTETAIVTMECFVFIAARILRKPFKTDSHKLVLYLEAIPCYSVS